MTYKLRGGYTIKAYYTAEREYLFFQKKYFIMEVFNPFCRWGHKEKIFKSPPALSYIPIYVQRFFVSRLSCICTLKSLRLFKCIMFAFELFKYSLVHNIDCAYFSTPRLYTVFKYIVLQDNIIQTFFLQTI